MTEFNTSQAKAIASNNTDIVVLAGPGSGKTRTLVARVENLIAQGVPPQRIVVITFTNAAADEVQSRLGRSDLGYCGTLHGFMLRVLQHFGRPLGFTGPITVLDEDDTAIFKADVMKRLNYKGSMEQFNKRLVEPFTPCRTMTALDISAEGYRRALIKANMVDYDSILVLGYRALDGKNSLDFYKHLLVDEFQDSGDWDARIYEKLPIESNFLIGDTDQAIFSFRGGNIEHILNRCKKAEVIYLEQNYRSDKSICDVAQSLIEHNKNRVAKKTIAVSPNMGVVDYWLDIPNPGREIAAIAEDIRKHNCQDDCAVLCRTNHLVMKVRETLESFGVKMKRTADKPLEFPFWKKARVFVSLLANPDNDFVALQWLKLNHDAKEANRMALVAASRKQTINECHLKLPRNLTLARVPAAMADAKFFQPTITEVAKMVDKLYPPADIAELCIAMTSSPAVAESPEDSAGTVVTTMHSAKGREWGTVYLPAFEQEVIPSNRKSVQIEEERRLAYVAFTRAKHRLVISVCKERQTEWQVKPHPATPSQFISEGQVD